MKWISSILIAALLVQTGYVPCAAQEPVIMKGDEIDRSKLKVGMYVEVTYYDKKGEGKTEKGYVKVVEDDALSVVYERPTEIIHQRQTKIKYRDIITLVVGRSEFAIERLRKKMAEKAVQPSQKAPQLIPGIKVRITAPSVAEGRLVGAVVTLSADTLVMKPKTGNLLVIPLTSVTEFEMRHGRKRFVGKGSAIGFLGGAVVGWFLPSGNLEEDEYGGGPIGAAILGGAGLVIGAIVGGIGYEQWEEMPLDRIRIGISPQRQGGMMLSTSFRF